jgi:HK97 family phage portal protein
VLVAPDGSVFYDVQQDFLAGVDGAVKIPASEIIHDRWNCLFHPLVGIAPLYASESSAIQAIQIERNSTKLFARGSQPSGLITAPQGISNDVADRAQKWWMENMAGEANVGNVGVLGDGMTYIPLGMTAVDSEIIKQLNLSDERICRAFHVPGYMVTVGGMPNYNNIEALNQQYYSQCLQVLIESAEECLDNGLGLDDAGYECEFDLDGLLRMDSATKMESVTKGIKGMVFTPNEGRAMFNKPPLDGGNTVYGQDQDHSIQWLNLRDQMPIEPKPVAPPSPPVEPMVPAKSFDDQQAFELALMRKTLETDWEADAAA